MKTNKLIMSSRLWFILLWAVCLASCTKRVIYTYCDEYTNKDSLIQCIVSNYDADALSALLYCHEDSNANFYRILVADSSENAYFYHTLPPSKNGYYRDLSDTASLFYNVKCIAMGGYPCFGSRWIPISFPDTIYNILYNAYIRRVSVKNKEKYAKEYNNLDSLYCVVLSSVDTESYEKFRLLSLGDSLLSVAIKVADSIHYPIACYDVYYCTINRHRVTDKEFRFAYKYLCEAVDSMYYPALFIKAGLCLTGAYFPQDTVLGKKLFEQCHATTTIPFWQQYSKPPVYQHLLKK